MTEPAPSDPSWAGLVLAAGRSERSDGPKALAKLDGETLVERAARTLREAGARVVILVVAPPHGARIVRSITGGGVTVAANPRPERGMLSSLQVGLEALGDHGIEVDAVVVSLVDHPRVRVETVQRLIEAWHRVRATALRPVHAGRGGHPVLLARACFAEVSEASPETSLRTLLAGRVVDVAVDDPGVVEDLDTAEALRAIGAELPDGEAK